MFIYIYVCVYVCVLNKRFKRAAGAVECNRRTKEIRTTGVQAKSKTVQQVHEELNPPDAS